MRHVGWVVVAAALLSAACTTEGQVGVTAGTSVQADPATSLEIAPTAPAGTGTSGDAWTVTEAQAELDARFAPELALRWQPIVLPPCEPSPFSALELDSHVVSASGSAQLDAAALDAVLDRVSAGGRTVPSLDGHRLVVGDGWEALVATEPAAAGGDDVEVTVGIVVAVQPAPLPDGVELVDACATPTRPSYQTTGTPLSG